MNSRSSAANRSSNDITGAWYGTCPCCSCLIPDDDLRAHLVAECVEGAVRRAELLQPLVRWVLSRLRAAHPVHRAAFDEATLSPANYTSVVLGGSFSLPGGRTIPLAKHWLGPAPPPRARGSTAARDAPTVVANNEPPPFIGAVRFMRHIMPKYRKAMRELRPRRD